MWTLLLTACWNPTAPLDPTLLRGSQVLADSGAARLVQHDWQVDDRRGWAWVVHLPADAKLTVHPSDGVQRLAHFPPVRDDEVLVNGGFYDDEAMGLVVHGGVVHAPLTDVGGSGVLQSSAGGGITIVHRTAWSPGPSEALQSIDRLVDEGVSLVKRREGVPETSRVAIGRDATGIVAVVAAGEQSTIRKPGRMELGASEHEGLPLWAFADLLVELGVRQAVNLDGGISTEANVVVDGRRFVVTGGIGTINAVRLTAR